MATDSGFNNQKKKGIAQFETVQSLGSSKYGKSVANKALFDKFTGSVASITDILGRDGQVEFWEIQTSAANSAEVGDVLKVSLFEFEIIQVISADTVRVLPVAEFKPIVSETSIVKSWVTQKANFDGSSSVAFTEAPDLYKYNGADQTVIQDTTTPSQNRALPSLAFIIKDGVQVPISKDTATPANTVGIPVELVAASGTSINITAGDLNVSTSSTNDSMAIGDPITGNKVEVIANTTGSQSLSVIDEDNIFQTTAINTKLNEVKTKQDTGNVSLNNIDGKTPTLGQKLMAGSSPVVIASDQSPIPVSGSFSIPNVSTEAKQDVQITRLGDLTETAPATDTASSGLNGRLQRIAQRLTSLIGLLPISLGQKNMAGSLSVTVASDQSTLAVSPISGVVDPTNSSTTPLGIGGVFTGAAFDITGYVAINVNVMSDVPSATNGVTLQVSPDGTNWDHSHSTTYTAATGVGYIFNAEARYARVVYTNGAAAQSFFRLQTIFKNTLTKSSLYTLSQSVNSNMFAELGRSVITGETTGGGGGYVNVKVNPSGALVTESTVSGSVSVSNFPATQPVSGSVSVSNFPATQAVTGTFWQAVQPVSGSVSVSNFPSTQNTSEQTQSGTITSTQLSVGLTAVRATVSGSAPSATRKKLMIKPSKNNTGAIYFGSSSVTTVNSMEIIGPDRLEFAFDASDYYLISDTAGQVVEIVEIA
jgi:hypothetical protein